MTAIAIMAWPLASHGRLAEYMKYSWLLSSSTGCASCSSAVEKLSLQNVLEVYDDQPAALQNHASCLSDLPYQVECSL